MQNRPLFNEIIRRYDQYIRLVVAKYFKNAMDRDDVFQEIMILLMEKVDKLDVNHPKANIKGWVGVLTRNKCISILRSQKKFDVILNMEIIEHVEDVNFFLKSSIVYGWSDIFYPSKASSFFFFLLFFVEDSFFLYAFLTLSIEDTISFTKSKRKV